MNESLERAISTLNKAKKSHEKINNSLRKTEFVIPTEKSLDLSTIEGDHYNENHLSIEDRELFTERFESIERISNSHLANMEPTFYEPIIETITEEHNLDHGFENALVHKIKYDKEKMNQKRNQNINNLKDSNEKNYFIDKEVSNNKKHLNNSTDPSITNDSMKESNHSIELVNEYTHIISHAIEIVALKKYYFHKWYHLARLHMLNRVRKAKADLFHNKRLNNNVIMLKKRAFEEWKLKTKLSQESTMLNELAELFYENLLKVACFREWGKSIHRKEEYNSLIKISQLHYEKNLKKTSLLQWKLAMIKKQKQFLSTYFKLWKNQIKKNKLLKQNEKLFKEKRNYYILISHFQKWKKSYSLSQLVHDLELYQGDKILIKYFKHWRDTLELKKNNQSLLKISINFHNRKLLAMGFKAFKMNVKLNAIKANRKRRTLQQFFSDWKCKFEINLYWKELSHLARVQYNLKLQQKILSLWKKYVQYRQEKKKKYAYAMYHYESRHADRLKVKYFYQWKNYCHIKRKIHFDKCKAEIFVKYRFFIAWKRIYSEQIALKDEMSEIHFKLMMMKRCFKQWKVYTLKKRITNKIKVNADKMYEDKLKRHFFTIWKMNYSLVEVENKIADNFYTILLLRHAFSNLVVAYDHTKARKEGIISAFRKKWDNERLYHIFMSWRVFSNQNLRKEYDKQRSDQFLKQNLLEKFFRLWYRKMVDKEMLSISELLTEVSIMNEYHERSSQILESKSREKYDLEIVNKSNHSFLSSGNSRMSDSIAYDEDGVQVSSIIIDRNAFTSNMLHNYVNK